jgi:hypothetical protein
MSIREYEAANLIPPIMNTTGVAMKSQANLVVSNAGVAQGLSALFGGGLGLGHFVTLEADGAKIDVAFSANSSGSLDAFATGNGPNICFPIPDGTMVPFVPVNGREVSTGVATMCNYDFIHARVRSGGVATAYLRMYRSSLAPNQDAREFKGPG